jgi:ABC-type multidrug transport system ATPase subunit
MDLMIEAQGLTKHFGEVEALAGLDLAVPTGQVLAILGPNGAGKSTLMKLLTLQLPFGSMLTRWMS